MKHFLTSVFLVVVMGSSAFADPIIHQMRVYYDQSNALTVSEISGPQYDVQFDSLHYLQPLNASRGRIWLRYIVSRDTTTAEACFHLNYNFINQFQYFQKDRSGRWYASALYGRKHPYPPDNLYATLTPRVQFHNTLDTLYVNVEPTSVISSSLANMGISYLIDWYRLLNLSIQVFAYYGLLVGVICFVAIFSFLIFIRLRERTYLYYFLYLINALFFLLTLNNYTFRLIYRWFLIDYWSVMDVYALFFSGMTVCLLLYSRAFLKLHTQAPFLNKLLGWAAFLKVLFYFLGVTCNHFVYESFSNPSLYLNAQFHSPIFDTLFLLPAFIAGIYRMLKGDRFARYFVLAFGILYLAFIAHSFGLAIVLSIIKRPESGFYTNAFFDFMIFEIVLFSLGLAERFRYDRIEKEQAMQQVIQQLEVNASLREKVNRELEEKVRERTLQLEEQAEEIKAINALLQKNNIQLEANVKDLAKARVTLKPVSFDEFKQTYPNEEACLNYLIDLKWSKGFVCRKCKHKAYIDGKTKHARRCNACWYEETPTIGTIFHKLKFPIEKAFYLLYLVTNNPKISIEELASQITISERTCWSYKNKILEAASAHKTRKSGVISWESIILNKSNASDD